MHALAMHVPEFIRLYRSPVAFTQQGLEKLNDITAKQFQRSTNHCDIQSLKQILEKWSRIKILEDKDFKQQTIKQVCSICKSPGHNRKTCKAWYLNFVDESVLYITVCNFICTIFMELLLQGYVLTHFIDFNVIDFIGPCCKHFINHRI